MSGKPRSLKIGPYTFKVYWSKQSWEKYIPKAKQVEGAVGRAFIRPNRLFVNGWELSLDMQKETLIHEILHACLGIFGFCTKELKAADDSSEIEETMIGLVSPTLFGVLRDNPTLTEWLLND